MTIERKKTSFTKRRSRVGLCARSAAGRAPTLEDRLTLVSVYAHPFPCPKLSNHRNAPVHIQSGLSDDEPEYLAIAFETVSRLYAKQLIPTFFVVVLISVYASFPFTKWGPGKHGTIAPAIAAWPQ